MVREFIARLRGLLSAQNGSIAVMGVMALSSVLGMSGLAVEIGNGYAAKVRNQRVTDLAALGAAVSYRSTTLTGQQAIDAASQVARDIVRANGIPGTPTVQMNGTTSIQVSVTTAVPIRLARMFSSSASYDVTNTAVASLSTTTTSTTTTGGGGCISALGAGSTAISVSGGASITGGGCTISTNGTIVSDNSSAKVTAKTITAFAINDAAAAYGQNAITTTTTNGITKQANGASDFIKDSNQAVKDALCQVNKLTGSTDTYNATTNPYGYVGGNTNCTSLLQAVPSLSNASTTDWSTGYGVKTASGFDSYKTGDYQCVYNVPAGTYSIRDLAIGGGCTVRFATGSTLLFRNVNMSGADLSFGNGDIVMTGTFTVNGNNTVTMGDGAHYFGTLSIGGGKSLTLGSGNLTVANGISVGGGAFLKANIAAGNTVILGKDSSGNSIAVSGGSKVCFTSDCTMATAAAGIFSATGSVNVQGGGSLVAFPKSVNHIINGDLIATAGILFAPGLYIIKGDFKNTTGSGNDSMNGTNVTFALGGTINFAGGSKFDLAAPSTSTGGYGIQDILFATKSSNASVLNAGAVGKASGTLYAPNSAFSATGGTAISNNGSACLTLLVNTIAASGSGTISTANCTSVTSGTTTTTTSTTGTVKLIQ